jgi:hypothetical protein
MTMAQFEHMSIKCVLGWSGENYFIKNKEENEPGAKELGLEGWELVGFWPNPEPYLRDSFKDSEEREIIQIAFFKRELSIN